MKINFLKNIHAPSDFSEIGIREYFDMVRSAKYERQILAFRSAVERQESKDAIAKIKQGIPAVTISGIFKGAIKNTNIETHSGFICIDFDKIDSVDKLKFQLQGDKYTYAVLYSASGNGLAALVKINGDKHRESYDGLKEYYFKNYAQLIDKSCTNVSRLRFLSMDRELYINERSSTFKDYPKPTAKAPKIYSAVLTGNEFNEVVNRITSGGHDLTQGDYARYLTIGFAISSEFKEAGRQYYHAICGQNSKYDTAHCDKQYDYCMRDMGQKKIRIGSFYHLCKEAGVELQSKESRHLVTIAKMAKKDGRTKESVVDIAESIGMDLEAAKEVAEQVFTKNVSLEITGETNVSIVNTFLKSNYRLRHNIITGEIEDRNVRINDKYKIIADMELNTMYMRFCDCTNGKISKDFFYTFIFSEYTESYNPFLEFFEINKDTKRSEELITQLSTTIVTDTPNVDKFLRHWGCGIISSIYGQHSPLVLVMAGELIGTGKTEWFRRLLPNSIKSYYAESKLDGGKDDDILMCKKIIIMDDEFSGKSKFEAKKFKELTSKQTFCIRPPYGQVAKDFNRIAVLCATTNDLNILNDPTGNRRIIPINVLDVNKEVYNSIDKTALLMAFYDLYHSGWEWQLSREDVRILNSTTDDFQATNYEAELIEAHFELPSSVNDVSAEWLTNTDIKTYIELLSKQRIFNTNKLSAELKLMGFTQVRRKTGRYYWVKKKHTGDPTAPKDRPVNPYVAPSLTAPTTQSHIDLP